MFKAFDKLSSRAKTIVILVFALVGVSLQFWQVLHESRQSVQILYLTVAIGFVAVAGMILSSIRSVDRNSAEIKKMEDRLTGNKRLIKELESI